MKLLVPVKRAIDYNVKLRVTMDGTAVDLTSVEMSMNPLTTLPWKRGSVSESAVTQIGIRVEEA